MKDLNTNTVTTSNISLASSKEVLERIRGLQCLTSAATSSGGFVNTEYINKKKSTNQQLSWDKELALMDLTSIFPNHY